MSYFARGILIPIQLQCRLFAYVHKAPLLTKLRFSVSCFCYLRTYESKIICLINTTMRYSMSAVFSMRFSPHGAFIGLRRRRVEAYIPRASWKVGGWGLLRSTKSVNGKVFVWFATRKAWFLRGFQNSWVGWKKIWWRLIDAEGLDGNIRIFTRCL